MNEYKSETEIREITVSIHAILRFAERILNITKNLSTEQCEHIDVIIKEAILEEHPEAYTIGAGSYLLEGYNAKIKLKNFNVMTVMHTDDIESPRLNGGVLRSGRKKLKSCRKDVAWQIRKVSQEKMESNLKIFD